MRTLADDTRTNIWQEQFIPDHVFIYLLKGAIRVFDGNESHTFVAGEACIARKNRLAKYEILNNGEPMQPVLFCFDEPFLRDFQEKHSVTPPVSSLQDTFIKVSESGLITSFIQSIQPYYKGAMQLEDAFEDLKYEELLVILLKMQPNLADVLFDFRKPGKIDLEEFMNRNFRFNVSMERFAYLTGRSLSAFKRDFKSIFDDTPSRWLIKKRLQEAHFLIEKKQRKPSEIYLELGFETLQHFSSAFKKLFGRTATDLSNAVKQ